MGEKIRLTMAQALVKFLNNQYISVDGKESRFVQGVMGIFGHVVPEYTRWREWNKVRGNLCKIRRSWRRVG